MKHAVVLFALASLLAVGGSAAPSSPGSETAAQAAGPTTQGPAERSGLRNARYCEIFVVTGRLNNIEGRVYNTFGLNDCPADQWNALDPEALKRQFGAEQIIMNGPRYFLMDRLTLQDPGGVASFGSLQMNLVATIRMPIGSLVFGGRRQPYSENTIERDTAWVFSSGRTVYELVAPNGQVYVM